MNRRQLFTAIAGTATAAGVTVQRVTAIEASSAPALAVIEMDQMISQDTVVRIVADLQHNFKGTPFEATPVFVLSDGMHLTFLDAQGRVLNRNMNQDA